MSTDLWKINKMSNFFRIKLKRFFSEGSLGRTSVHCGVAALTTPQSVMSRHTVCLIHSPSCPNVMDM